MVSAIRQARRDRQKKHIPSPQVLDVASNRYIPNPELKKPSKKEKKRKK